MPKSVSIIGLGWLGLPLALALKKEGDSTLKIVGTKTDSKGIASVNAIAKTEGIDTLLFNTTLDFSLREKGIWSLFSSDTVVITLPPSAHHGSRKYPAIIKALVKTAKYCGAKRIVFTSSISVYGVNSLSKQNEHVTITEECPLNPITPSAKALVEIEDFLLNHQPLPTTIFRLGGLIGTHRHPITHLSDKPLQNPYGGVYLVHRNDVIAAFLKLIFSQFTNKSIYNIVAPETPTRIDYYTDMAKLYSLAPPLLEDKIKEEQDPSPTITIDSNKFCHTYNFQFNKSIYDKVKLAGKPLH